MDAITTRFLPKDQWTSVSRIYKDGIATGIAIFETEVPNWEQWNYKYIEPCRIVAFIEDEVVGFAMLSKVSKREVYHCVAEVSVYVDMVFKGLRIDKTLLK